MQDGLENRNVRAFSPLPTPAALHERIPLDSSARAFVEHSRSMIADIVAGRDPRLLAIVGPCSIHDLDAARDYVERLCGLARDIETRVLVVMRVYFEKPRTTVGWKGFINDPDLDDSFDIGAGLLRARQFLAELAASGMAAGTEALDPIVPQYIGDLVSWYAIGARTTESQTHREMASGLSAPCGFKNGTDGSIGVAVNALQAARSPHHFLGIDGAGRPSVVRTRGNPDVHLILRGGARPNYDAGSIDAAVEALARAGLAPAVMVDCSHGNSAKDPARQAEVARAVAAQRRAGQRALVGLMLESHLGWGNQAFKGDAATLAYGVSITDACIDWSTTETLLQELAETSVIDAVS